MAETSTLSQGSSKFKDRKQFLVHKTLSTTALTTNTVEGLRSWFQSSEEPGNFYAFFKVDDNRPSALDFMYQAPLLFV